MRIRILSCSVVASLLLAANAEAQFFPPPSVVPGEDYHIELGVMSWTPTPELLISTDSGVVDGDIDYVQEFGIEDKKFPEFRLVLKPGRKHKLRASYVPIRYTEDAVIQRDLVLNGRRFTANLPVNAVLKWDLWRFGYEWDFVSRDRGFVGVLLDLKYNRVSVDLESPIAAEFAEVQAPVPTIGGVARAYLAENLSVTAEISAVKVPDRISEEFDAKFIDVDVYGTLNLGRHAGAQGGYRSIVADYLVDGDTGNLKMKGWYFGGVVRF